ncbi:hypothetical protein [Methanocella conradii]|uniref:hypothetical protein n=1 Tax=Methanocella conradii TaxID=1175444 RepID=UPI00157C81A3|nr:hypothetical protein [Methanocella conradii]
MGKSIAGAVLVAAIACMAMQASGQLFPMSFGFPNIVQISTTTAWQHDAMDAFSFDDFSINFPATGGCLPLGGVGLAFPSIHQTSIRALSMSHTEFSQTTELAAIGYPFISIGPGPFGGFTLRGLWGKEAKVF